MSLPGGSANEDHSDCSETSCNCFNVNQTIYRTRHTENCILCKDIIVPEEQLVHLIAKSEIPLVRSTIDSDGNTDIAITKMSMHADYTAISHVWVGGLGNFKHNWLPHCQLRAIHQDVCDTIAHPYDDSIANLDDDFFPEKQITLLLKSRRPRSPRWWSCRNMRNTCYYWMNALCIPVNHSHERKLAINSIGRFYAGAAKGLVLGPIWSRVNYNDLQNELHRNERANMLIAASPWMARSWTLQEYVHFAMSSRQLLVSLYVAHLSRHLFKIHTNITNRAALAPAIYVKFADCKMPYNHSHLGAAATLTSIPNQKENEENHS